MGRSSDEGLEKLAGELREMNPRLHNFLKMLVRTPSLSGQEREVATIVASEMEQLGYDVEVDEMGSVIGRRGSGGRLILFDGHLDHVEAGSPDRWRYSPYEGEVVKDLLYGRGVVDAKGGLVAMIYGCSLPELEGEIIVSCVVHEETVEGVATRHIIDSLERKPHAAVICEPSDLRLSIGQRGRCVLKVRTRGVTSHASMPELGINAIYEMLPILEGIKKMRDRLPRHPLLGRGSVAITDIRCSPGSGPIIPDLCIIRVDRRLIPSESPERVLEEVKALAQGLEAQLVEEEILCYTGYRVMVRHYFPGWITSEEHWLVKESLKTLEETLGRRPQITTWRFSTDGVATAGELGIPTVGFGPGDPSLAHQPNEHIALRDVERAALAYSVLAKRLSRSRNTFTHPSPYAS